jgi:hypothetical protein
MSRTSFIVLIVLILFVSGCTTRTTGDWRLDYPEPTQQEIDYYNECFNEEEVYRGPPPCGAIVEITNPRICDYIIDYREYNVNRSISCFIVAVNYYVYDIRLCEEIPNDKLILDKDHCYEGFAVRNRDISICHGLESQSSRDLCYFHMGTEYDDPNYCALISNEASERYRNQCFMNTETKEF